MSQESACGDEQLCNRLDIRACLAYVAGAFLLLLRVSYTSLTIHLKNACLHYHYIVHLIVFV